MSTLYSTVVTSLQSHSTEDCSNDTGILYSKSKPKLARTTNGFTNAQHRRTTEVQTRATNQYKFRRRAEMPELFNDNEQRLLICGIHGGLSISLLNSIATIRVRTGPTIHSLGGDETPEANQALSTRQTLLRNRHSPQLDSIIRHNSKHVRAKLATQTPFSSVLH